MADISKAIRAEVASRMCGAPILDLVITEEESDSEEDPTPEPKRKTIKLGKLRTADSSILHKVVWLHEVVYTAMSKLTKYEDISIPLFISGCMAVMAMKSRPSIL